MFNVNEFKKQFPILERTYSGKRLVYLDNAATSQKPNAVIDAMTDFYKNHNANVHRGIHFLSEEATEAYELARKKVADFIGATVPAEVVFTKGTTDSINMVAFGWAMQHLKEGDVILTTISEHHSNLIPWQQVCEKTGAKLSFVYTDEKGVFTEKDVKEKITPDVKLVAVSQASNVLGNFLDIKEISRKAKEVGAKVLVDGAQSVPHMKVHMQSLGCDFFVFSGHKMMGPTGIGVLWIKRDLFEEFSPVVFGGGMINEVFETSATWADMPEKLEAGTPNISGAVGLAAAVDFLSNIDHKDSALYMNELISYAFSKLSKIDGINILGSNDVKTRASIISFYFKNIHAHDIASVLNAEGVAVRSGHHCTMPLHSYLKVPATTRASFYLYNTIEDVDALVLALEKVKKILL